MQALVCKGRADWRGANADPLVAFQLGRTTGGAGIQVDNDENWQVGLEI